MALTPKYSAAIVIPNGFFVKVFFARPVDSDVFQDLQNLSLYEGIDVKHLGTIEGKPWIIQVSPVYDTKDVGLKIERILRKHGINDIKITIDEVGSSRELETLEGLAE